MNVTNLFTPIIYYPELQVMLDVVKENKRINHIHEIDDLVVVILLLRHYQEIANWALTIPIIQQWSLERLLEDSQKHLDRELTTGECYLLYDIHREMIDHYTN